MSDIFDTLLATCRDHGHVHVEHIGEDSFTATVTKNTRAEFILARASEEYSDVCQETGGVFTVYR